MSVVDKLHNGLLVFMAICVGVFVFEGMEYMEFDVTEKEKAQYVKTATMAGVLFLTAGIVNILLPDEMVMYKMLAASYVTPDNIGAVQHNVVDFVGQIADGLAKVKK
ncbi:hypothetical protein [uncultured Acidaminococcus sp.]|uniref:hypothetical protein n=1 Tax=uncultured Acidaminococcus sp. TaxID=352152 RepID=UPI0025937CE8|nr:hypothetical protein [uncultured Acidaminococcus sp.]